MRIGYKFGPVLILGVFSILHCACHKTEFPLAGHVITVEELVTNHSKYATEFVDVRGELILEFHGNVLQDESECCGFFVIPPEAVTPEPDFKLVRDSMYQRYEKLMIEVGSVQRRLGKAKLIGTLRGKYYLGSSESTGGALVIPQLPDPLARRPMQHRFVLHRVIKLDVQKLQPK
jgi:hypothetical protein